MNLHFFCVFLFLNTREDSISQFSCIFRFNNVFHKLLSFVLVFESILLSTFDKRIFTNFQHFADIFPNALRLQNIGASGNAEDLPVPLSNDYPYRIPLLFLLLFYCIFFLFRKSYKMYVVSFIIEYRYFVIHTPVYVMTNCFLLSLPPIVFTFMEA